jgi:hypothetical protein
MSRAMNLTLDETKVRRACTTAGVDISVIEPLISGGTRLVCTTGPGADAIRLRLARHLIDGTVTRHRFYRPPGT